MQLSPSSLLVVGVQARSFMACSFQGAFEDGRCCGPRGAFLRSGACQSDQVCSWLQGLQSRHSSDQNTSHNINKHYEVVVDILISPSMVQRRQQQVPC